MSGVRPRSPGRLAVVAPAPPSPSSPYKGAFLLVMACAVRFAMRDKPEGVLLMCGASFFMALACQFCLDITADAEHGPACIAGCAVIVCLCAFQIHQVEVYTSAKEPLQYASVNFAALKRVLQEVPVCVKAASACRETQEEVAYLRTLTFANVTQGNSTLDWPQWLFVLENSLRKGAP